MNMTVEDIVEAARKGSMHLLIERGNITPSLLMYTETEAIPVMFPFTNDQEKRAAMGLIKLLLLKYRAYAYTVAFEGFYLAKMDKSAIIEGRISEHPDRREGLFVGYVSHDRTELHTWDMFRDEDGKVDHFGKDNFDVETKLSGSFYELLAPRELILAERTPEQEAALDEVIEKTGCIVKFEADKNT